MLCLQNKYVTLKTKIKRLIETERKHIEYNIVYSTGYKLIIINTYVSIEVVVSTSNSVQCII